MKKDESLVNKVCYGYRVERGKVGDHHIIRLDSNGKEQEIDHNKYLRVITNTNLDRVIIIVCSMLYDSVVINQDYVRGILEKNGRLFAEKFLKDIILGHNEQSLLLEACIKMIGMFKKYINSNKEEITLGLNPKNQHSLNRAITGLEPRLKKQLKDILELDAKLKKLFNEAATAQPEQSTEQSETVYGFNDIEREIEVAFKGLTEVVLGENKEDSSVPKEKTTLEFKANKVSRLLEELNKDIEGLEAFAVQSTQQEEPQTAVQPTTETAKASLETLTATEAELTAELGTEAPCSPGQSTSETHKRNRLRQFAHNVAKAFCIH